MAGNLLSSSTSGIQLRHVPTSLISLFCLRVRLNLGYYFHGIRGILGHACAQGLLRSLLETRPNAIKSGAGSGNGKERLSVRDIK